MFPLPLLLSPRRSRTWAALRGLATLLAAAALILADLPDPARLAGAAALAWDFWRSLRPEPLRTYRCTAKGELELREGDAWTPLHRLPGGAANPFFLFLRYRAAAGGPARALLVGRDSLDHADFRRLAVWMRWKPQARPDFSHG